MGLGTEKVFLRHLSETLGANGEWKQGDKCASVENPSETLFKKSFVSKGLQRLKSVSEI